jgi:hypothetical protein
VDKDRLLHLMDESGIDMAVVSDIGEVMGAGGGADINHERLIPFHTVRPDTNIKSLSDAVQGIRIYPTYHAWDFSGSSWAKLLERAEVEGWIVQVYLRLRDPRVLPQQVVSADIMQSLGGIIESNSSVRFVITGMNFFEAEGYLPLLRRENAWFEVSHLQHPMAPLDKLTEKIGASRMLFGTSVPFFYPFVTTFRTMHSKLSQGEMSRILSGNAVNLLVM